jgi:hypothetical protein
VYSASSQIDSFGSSPSTYPCNPPYQTRTLLEICWLFVSIHSPFSILRVTLVLSGHSLLGILPQGVDSQEQSILALSTTVVLDDLDVRRREQLE